MHIEQALGASRASHPFFDGPTYGAPHYKHHDRAVAAELRDLHAVTRKLIDPLFSVISSRGYDPFEAARSR